MRPPHEYTIFFNGSRAIRNGYLNCQPEVPQTPAPLEDLSQAFGRADVPSLIARLDPILRKRALTLVELCSTLKAKPCQVNTALARIRRNGILRSKKGRTTIGHRHYVNHYWIEDGRTGS